MSGVEVMQEKGTSILEVAEDLGKIVRGIEMKLGLHNLPSAECEKAEEVSPVIYAIKESLRSILERLQRIDAEVSDLGS